MAQDTGRGEPSSSYTGDASVDDLAVKLSELARTLHDERDLHDTLVAIANAAVDTVPGAQYAGLLVVERRQGVSSRAATDDLVYQVDRAQLDTGQGPCLQAAYEQQTVRLPDMTAEHRWPEFARRATELGVLSMLSFQLYVERDNLGALNLYSRDVDSFDDESEQVGLLFATHAAIAMAGAQQQEQLGRAVAVRDLIGQAKGILMERHKLTSDQAFSLLVGASQATNTKLVEVARQLTETGELHRPGPQRWAVSRLVDPVRPSANRHHLADSSPGLAEGRAHKQAD